MLSDEIKKVAINEQKLIQMKKLIIAAERQNLKTGEYATQDMVKVIRKIIEKNVDQQGGHYYVNKKHYTAKLPPI